MKRNDKLIVLIGVTILVVASIGVFYYQTPEETKVKIVEMDDIINASGSFLTVPEAIAVSDSCPFYALIATPLAVHYNANGEQEIIPLLVENLDEPSSAVTRVKDQLEIYTGETIDDSKSAKDCSLSIAKQYWEKSKAVILIKYNEDGYNLGVAATPIASYLSIPVIVTDELDEDVKNVLKDLGVEYSFVCGDIEGYEKSVRFDNADEIIDATTEIVFEKFGDVKYITLTNPRDAWPPEVLNTSQVLYKKGTLEDSNAFPSHIIDNFRGYGVEGDAVELTIPEDYKYALVKVDFKNLEDPEHVEKFGDRIYIGGGLTRFTCTGASPAKRDINGNVEYDRFYYETVLYDMGGEKFSINFNPTFHILRQADYEIDVIVDKLSDPYYPLMKQLSSLAPYITAYHKGIVFAKTEFAFAADDDKLLDGKTMRGRAQPLFNAQMIPLTNRHVYDTIHKPINELLAELKDVDLTDDNGKEILTKLCKREPFYIALVGDTTMLPQYYYRSPHNNPFDNPGGGPYGVNCPSDFIYGNVDPETYFMRPHIGMEDTDNDLYTSYPEMENIVGRITGWDVQDASALIARTIYYSEIIDKLGEWKNNAVAMAGSGSEVQRIPLLDRRYNKEPIKFPSGEKLFMNMRIAHNLEKGGFNVVTTQRGRAQRVGYSDEALWDIKRDGLLNRLFFPRRYVKLIQGFENFYSLLDPQWWRESLSDGSGVMGGELQENSNIILSDSHGITYGIEHGDVMMSLTGGPPILYLFLGRILGFDVNTPLRNLGEYNVREVANMEMGPSVMLIEACGSGKIDGIPPTNTLANTYLHAGVNAYISPTTYSAFYGALNPRPKWPFYDEGVGLGIVGFLKAWRNARQDIYPPVHFSQVIFEKTYQSLIEDNADIGVALRDAKNDFLPEQANVTYLWTPVLTSSTSGGEMKNTGRGGGGDRHILEKYCAVYQLNLLGDPAFNPYEPCNEGK